MEGKMREMRPLDWNGRMDGLLSVWRWVRKGLFYILIKKDYFILV